ncbi:MAG: hypothetical protein QNK40_15035, partial [Desulfobacterales bacterium]|nr:hypothetical protein [Desulfobacterales bacterium]MDX2510162.1 hypothetical protein [Desulfobacterales bacterium]
AADRIKRSRNVEIRNWKFDKFVKSYNMQLYGTIIENNLSIISIGYDLVGRKIFLNVEHRMMKSLRSAGLKLAEYIIQNSTLNVRRS